MKQFLSIFLLLSFCGYMPGQNPEPKIAKGTVFIDSNRNGIKDGLEQGMKGVLVSNGKDVVKTRSMGDFEINLQEDGIVFMIKPSGYMVPQSLDHLPRFYYIHRDHEASCKQYPGMKPTGPLPEHIDFPLFPQEESDSFSILVLGDTQPKNMSQVNYLARDIVDELTGVKNAAFGVTWGDNVDDDLTMFEQVNHVIGRIGIPWFNVLGNHDQNYDVPRDEEANQSFEANYGPATYSFNFGKVHFLVLDDIVYKGYNSSSSGYVGGFAPNILEFIKNDLEHVSKEQLIVLMMHIPLFNESPTSQSFRPEDRQNLFDILKDFPHTFSISAHTHIQRHYFFKREDGWMGSGEHHHYNAGTACGSWWSGEPDEFGVPHATMRDGTPNGYAWVRFEGNQYILDYKAARRSTDYRMSVYAPRSIRRGEYPTSRLYVNFFMGTIKTRVYSKIGFGGEWQEMAPSFSPDPFMSALNVRYDMADHPLPGPRLSSPTNSHHLWQMSIPTNLPVGLQHVDIKVVDMWGREFFSSTSFRME